MSGERKLAGQGDSEKTSGPLLPTMLSVCLSVCLPARLLAMLAKYLCVSACLLHFTFPYACIAGNAGPVEYARHEEKPLCLMSTKKGDRSGSGSWGPGGFLRNRMNGCRRGLDQGERKGGRETSSIRYGRTHGGRNGGVEAVFFFALFGVLEYRNDWKFLPLTCPPE